MNTQENALDMLDPDHAFWYIPKPGDKVEADSRLGEVTFVGEKALVEFESGGSGRFEFEELRKV